MAYEQKFASLIQLCREAQSKGIDVIMVAYPWVIGDDYEEMARSLTLIAEANLLLCITAGNADSGKYTRN